MNGAKKGLCDPLGSGSSVPLVGSLVVNSEDDTLNNKREEGTMEIRVLRGSSWQATLKRPVKDKNKSTLGRVVGMSD